jgi:16S rRNA (cytosine1402-N4)-methyltransferase
MNNTEILHIPVLKKETIQGLLVSPHDIYLDGTLGSGGHAEFAIESAGGDITVIGLDKDNNALARSKNRLENFVKEKGYKNTKLYFIQSSFGDIDKVLNNLGIEKVDKIILDIGVSSEEIDISGRGFSFKRDEPLLMTLKDTVEEGDITAEVIVNTWGEETIADLIYAYGEERYSRKIAKAIVINRDIKPIKTTFDLVDIINSAVPGSYKRGKIHPATRTFQALRITVNDELTTLKHGLDKGLNSLKSGGRMAVISFHSLEDRIVKNFFREKSKENQIILINKKPIVPPDEEIEINKRSRSAKLRIIEKK